VNVSRALSYGRALLGILHGRRALGGPVELSLSLTARCNLRCVHCYYRAPGIEQPNVPAVRLARQAGGEPATVASSEQTDEPDADPPALKAVISAALALGTRRFQFAGPGEPFLHGSTLDCAAQVKAGGGYCRANTNGTLLDAAVANELVRLGFDDLYVTTMAGTPETYKRTHPGSPPELFGRLRDNLTYLAERKKALGRRKPRVAVTSVLIAENCDDLTHLARFARQVGADAVVLRAFDDVGDAGLTAVAPKAEQVVRARAAALDTDRYLAAAGISSNIALFLKVFGRVIDTTALYRTVPCYYGWLQTRVERDGTVYPCCRCYLPLGNAFHDGLHSVWYGEPYRRFRERARALPRSGQYPDGCECGRCVHWAANLRAYHMLHPVRSRLHRPGVQAVQPCGQREEAP
jgi:MoaA/NifB/PqqE/SkfB family radical SAM enzyme